MHVLISILALVSGQLLNTKKKGGKNVEKKWKSRWEDGAVVPEGKMLNISYEVAFMTMDISFNRKWWEENLKRLMCDWVVLSVKIKNVSCSNLRACITFPTVPTKCHSVLRIHFVVNGKIQLEKKENIFLFDKSICLLLNTFNFSVVYACSGTLQQV